MYINASLKMRTNYNKIVFITYLIVDQPFMRTKKKDKLLYYENI